MKLRIKILDQRAKVPTYGTDYSAGADLYALDGMSIDAHATAFAHTGIAMEIPEGYVGLIFARSGMACKRGLAPANKVGVIDSDYRGEIMVALHNHTDAPVSFDDGERVAQIAIVPYLKADFEIADSLDDTARAGGGFGSTGRS